MALSSERIAAASFIGTSVLAGGNAVGIRFSNRELAPLWGAGVRFSLAALLLLAAMAILRLEWPRGRALAGSVVFGLLNFGAAFGLGYYALVRIHAGFGQTLLALVPLATLALAVAFGQERYRIGAVGGTVLALVGVGVMSSTSFEGSVPVLSVVATLGSVLCLALAAVLVRRFPRVHPVTMNAVGMTAGGLALLLASVVAREPLVLPQRAATWLALAYLVVIGSGAVFVLYLVVLRHWAASRAAYTFVLIPIVTVALSVWLDDEPISPGLVIGGVLVLAGVYVGALRQQDPASTLEVAASRDGR
ncbi:MAG TPA: EamA family transporter [Jiangellales bacterium]|nr:EamA family transporter [Jiangellales bacterium]